MDTAQWSASTMWQEGYGVRLQELSRKMDLMWWSSGKDISVKQLKPLRFLSVGLHEVLSYHSSRLETRQQLVECMIKAAASCSVE